MTSNLENIKEVISTLNLNDEFDLLSKEETLMNFIKIENKFVNKKGLRWLWEDFKLQYEIIEENDKPWENINSFIPDGCEKVLLMIESDSKFYPIFKCNPKLIPTVLNECYWFEYYIIDLEHNWLICENHHNTIFVTGSLINKSDEA